MNYRKKFGWMSLLATLLLLVAGCGEAADGASCTTETLDNGDVQISCDDGTTSTIEAPGEPEDCIAEDNGDDTFTITCPGSDPFTVEAGEDDSCTTTDNEDGTYTIECPNQDTVTIDTTNETCSAVDNEDGTYTIDCPGQDPVTFEEDSRCTLSDNGDGTHDLTCGDETITVEG